MSQNKKSYLWQTHSQYHTEWAKAGIIPFENQHKTRMPSLTTPIQHSIGSSGQGNQARERNKGQSTRKRGSQIVSLCRWHNCIFRKPNLKLISNFSKVSGYKISVQKLQVLYNNNRELNNEWTPIHDCYKKNKIPRNTTYKGCEGPLQGGLLKEIRGHEQMENIPYSLIVRISIVKIAILSKVIYRFYAIPIKLPISFFKELEKTP